MLCSVQVFANDRCGDIEAIEKVAPEYPIIEVHPKHEGYVLLEYVINKDGTVSDVQAVEVSSKPTDRYKNGFSRSAVNAILKWKYPAMEKPCIHQQKLTYKLEGINA